MTVEMTVKTTVEMTVKTTLKTTLKTTVSDLHCLPWTVMIHLPNTTLTNPTVMSSRWSVSATLRTHSPFFQQALLHTQVGLDDTRIRETGHCMWPHQEHNDHLVDHSIQNTYNPVNNCSFNRLVMNYGIWVVKYELWNMNYEIWVVNHEIWIVKHELLTMETNLFLSGKSIHRTKA